MSFLLTDVLVADDAGFKAVVDCIRTRFTVGDGREGKIWSVIVPYSRKFGAPKAETELERRKLNERKKHFSDTNSATGNNMFTPIGKSGVTIPKQEARVEEVWGGTHAAVSRGVAKPKEPVEQVDVSCMGAWLIRIAKMQEWRRIYVLVRMRVM